MRPRVAFSLNKKELLVRLASIVRKSKQKFSMLSYISVKCDKKHNQNFSDVSEAIRKSEWNLRNVSDKIENPTNLMLWYGGNLC